MKTGKRGIELIKSFESCKLEAYLDFPGKVPTIGWGHTAGVKLGDVCSQEQADQWLEEDLKDAEDIVNWGVKVSLTQNQFDALVSFVYNIGPGMPKKKDGFLWLRALDVDGNPEGSTLRRKINAGNFAGAATEFRKWGKAMGQEVPGLVRRRLAEKALFELEEANG
jgi:lysozyme